VRSGAILTIFSTATLVVGAAGLGSGAVLADEELGTAEHPRQVAISMTDALRFDPDLIEVTAGETIEFVLTNPTSVAHDFTVGDLEAQEAHEAQMAAGMDHDEDMDMADDDADHDEDMDMADDDADHAHGEASAPGLPAPVSVEPGETVSVLGTFAEPGDVLIGCHEPGHWAAGMKGLIRVGAASA
jgi:uncharacterized cupredoxin-like copper-binding protein